MGPGIALCCMSALPSVFPSPLCPPPLCVPLPSVSPVCPPPLCVPLPLCPPPPCVVPWTDGGHSMYRAWNGVACVARVFIVAWGGQGCGLWLPLASAATAGVLTKVLRVVQELPRRMI